MKLENGLKKSIKSAPKPAPAREIKPATSTNPATTTIEAKIDVGFGNNLFVRGEGAGLSWEQGKPLKCVDGKTWQCALEAKDPLKFKLLLNDSVWMAGEDQVAQPGKRVEITPSF